MRVNGIVFMCVPSYCMAVLKQGTPLCAHHRNARSLIDNQYIYNNQRISLKLNLRNYYWCILLQGTADGGTVLKVLCYKSEGRWFDSRWCQWNFSLT
jgi:hypothetical protein